MTAPAGNAAPRADSTDESLPLGIRERRVRSFDGTDIAYHEVGQGPPILLANGLGGSWMAWQHQLRALSDRYRFLSWDQRGLYRSGVPPRRDALDIPAQARDGLAVLDAAGVDKTALWGWSMGVQTALEMVRLAPERVSAIVLINGVAGNPWATLAGMPRVGALAPALLRTLRRMPRLVAGITRVAVSSPHTPALAKRLGIAADTLDEVIFHQLAHSFADLDMEIYVRTLEAIGEHDAHDMLARIDVPLLMIAGGRDLMTPRSAADRIVREVRDAELFVIPGGTHYVAVEYPELLTGRVTRFMDEKGWPAGRKP